MIICTQALGHHRKLKIASLVLFGFVTTGLQATAQTPDKWETAANTFKANCTNCHAEDGSGTAIGNRLHVKNLYSKEVQEKSNSDLIQTIGAGKDNMPAFKDRLSFEQIEELVEYIRHEAQKSH